MTEINYYPMRKKTKRHRAVKAILPFDPDVEVYECFPEHGCNDICCMLGTLGFHVFGCDPQYFWAVKSKLSDKKLKELVDWNNLVDF